MMKRTMIILQSLFGLIVFAACGTGHRHYTYECKEDYSIQFIGLSNNSNVTIINSTNCNNKSVTVTDGMMKINSSCIEKDNATRKAVVTLEVSDPKMYATSANSHKRAGAKRDGNANSSTTTTTKSSTTPSSSSSTTTTTKSSTTPSSSSSTTAHTTTHVQVFGGKGTEKYKLTCMFIPENGTLETAIKHFNGKDNDILEPVNFGVDGIDIRFKPEPKSSSRDLSAVYVGDEFYMFIKYLGDHDYHVRPTKCTAYQGRSTSSDVKAVIWQDKQGCILEKFDGTHVMEQFHSTTVDKKTVYAKMYGFHFQKEQDITIECEVLICDSVNCNGSLSCKSGYSKRKRRQSLTSQKHMSGQRSVHVYDSKLDTVESTNGASHPLHDLTLYYVATAYALVKRIL